MEQPRFELLDADGRVLATAPVTEDLLTESDVDGDTKEMQLQVRITQRGRVAHYRTIAANGEESIGPVVKIDRSLNISLPLYLPDVDLEPGAHLNMGYRITTWKDTK